MNTNSFRIVPAEPAWGPAMQALIISVLREYGLTPDTSSVDADVLDISQHYLAEGGAFFAVFDNESSAPNLANLCGTMGIKKLDGARCELRKMYIKPEVRGKGLGKQLLQLAEQTAKQKGFFRMELETASVLKEAIALYEKNGFQRTDGTPHVGRCDRIYFKNLD